MHVQRETIAWWSRGLTQNVGSFREEDLDNRIVIPERSPGQGRARVRVRPVDAVGMHAKVKEPLYLP